VVEDFPQDERGRGLAIVTAMLTLGGIFVGLLAALGLQGTPLSWRAFYLLGIVPLILVGLGKWLLVFIIYLVGVVIWALLVGVSGVGGPVFVVVVAVGGGIALLWFLAFVLSGYALTTPAVVLEELSSSFDAFGRSWDLTRSHKLKVFFLWLVGWLLTWFVPFLFFFGLGVLVSLRAPSLQLPLVVVNTVVSIALAAALPCVYTLMYYDLRMRREGFDLQLLGQQLGIG